MKNVDGEMSSEDEWVGNDSESVGLSLDTWTSVSQLLLKFAVPFFLSHINERVEVAKNFYRKAKLLKQWFP